MKAPSAPPPAPIAVGDTNGSIATFEDSKGNTLHLPMSFVQIPGAPGTVMMTHGLGAKNPRVKSHENDEWLKDVLIPAVSSCGWSYCSYTARGHGTSTGCKTNTNTNTKR